MITYTPQHLKEDLLITLCFFIVNFFNSFYIFCISLFSFLLSLFKLSCTKKYLAYNLYCISYTLRFCYVMYYIVLEICIGGRFLEDCFHCCSQQIMSDVANKSLLSYNLTKRAPGTWNL